MQGSVLAGIVALRGGAPMKHDDVALNVHGIIQKFHHGQSAGDIRAETMKRRVWHCDKMNWLAPEVPGVVEQEWT